MNWANRIDNRTQITVSELTFDNLASHGNTGQASTISGVGRDRKCGYRHGVVTNLGDIEQKLWQELAYELIQNSGEIELFENLFTWESETNYCKRSPSDLKHHVLELHVMRIFDRKEWVYYKDFNAKYPRHKNKQMIDDTLNLMQDSITSGFIFFFE